MPVTLSTRDRGFEAGFRQLLAANRESAADVDAVVAEIIEDVAARGDAALIDYTRRFDGMELAAGCLRLTVREIANGAAAAAPAVRARTFRRPLPCLLQPSLAPPPGKLGIVEWAAYA